ncbi:MAG: hypothetical protein IJR83_01180 [Clostridia bacterium]|nr:hypothetical protein [Clostridia bacterium]
MLIYAIVSLALAAVFLPLGIMLSMGKANLVHDYHLENVPQERHGDYAKALAHGVFTVCASLALSGGLALISHIGGQQKALAVAAVCILPAGLASGVVMLIIAHRKYTKNKDF